MLGDGQLQGGFFAGGEIGLAKATVPTAFSLTMLAWAYLRYRDVRGGGGEEW